MSQLKFKVIGLYKNLLYYGREYPAGYDYFRHRLKKAFIKNSHLEDSEAINKQIEVGEFVIKELDALYKLRKYRFLKRNYVDTVEEENKIINKEALKSAKSILASYTKE